MKKLIVLLLSLIAIASPLRANDATIGGMGSEVMLLSEKRIRMVAEDIRITQKNEYSPDWDVEAHYIFENPTDKPVTVTMGFPEMRHCEDTEEYGDTYDPSFRNFITTVRGTPVTHSTVSITKPEEWEFCLGNVYAFEVSFAPREVVQVHHSYEYSGTTSVMGDYVSYLTRTGSLWNGPIGSAQFTVSIAGLPGSISWPNEYVLADQYRERVAGHDTSFMRSVYVFRQQNWMPNHNFFVEFVDGAATWYTHTPVECPGMWDFEEALRNGGEEEALSLLRSYPDSALPICRNMIYARYGRPFTNAAVRDLFYRAPHAGYWYSADLGDEDPEITTMYFAENRLYADSIVSEIDRRYAMMMKQIENERNEKAGAEATTHEE